MTRFYNKFLAAASAMMLTLTGCVNEDSPCPGDGDEATKVTLQFTVMTHNPAASRDAQQSRATGAEASLLSRAGDDCYDDIQGSPAENYINTSDCQFLLFDADRKLLRPIFPEITGKDDVQYTYYTIKASITEPYFDEAVKADRDQIDFYIMVIANSHSTGLDGQYPGLTPGVTTIEDIAAQKIIYNLPSQGKIGDMYWTSSWSPSIESQNCIPMAGLQKFTVSATQLKESTYDVPVYLSDENANGKTIDMLRAMAKIEVIDKIDLPDGYDPNIKRMKVEKVELIGFYRKGTILPLIGSTGQWPDYVSEDINLPNVPSLNYYAVPVPIEGEMYAGPNQGKCIMFDEDKYSSKTEHENYPVYSCYITEYSKLAVGNDTKPYIVVTLIDENSPDQETSFFKELKLTGYVDGAPQGDGIDFLLRNHIYRYEINAVGSSEANIIEVGYTVCDWDRHSVDIPTFN